MWCFTLRRIVKAGKTQLRITRLFAFLLLLSACASAPVVPGPEAHIVAPLPFYPDGTYRCGPATLAAVLNFRGVAVTPAEIAAEIFSPSARGALDMEMVFYAEAKGLRVRRYAGTEEDIKRNIDRGNPLIALVDYGHWVYEQGHFLVIIGYDDQGFIVNSGKDQRKAIPREEFLKVWRKAGFWALLVESRSGS